MGRRPKSSNLHHRRFDLRDLGGFTAEILLSIRRLVALGLKGEMSNGILTKLIVTVIILIAFWVGMTLDRHPSNCLNNCPTDISSSRR